MGLLPDNTGFLLPRPAYKASKPMIIFHGQFRIFVFVWWMCVRVAVAENVRSGSVAVVSGIFIATTDDCRTTCKPYTRRM